jgi:hypothetical protein
MLPLTLQLNYREVVYCSVVSHSAYSVWRVCACDTPVVGDFIFGTLDFFVCSLVFSIISLFITRYPAVLFFCCYTIIPAGITPGEDWCHHVRTVDYSVVCVTALFSSSFFFLESLRCFVTNLTDQLLKERHTPVGARKTRN